MPQNRSAGLLVSAWVTSPTLLSKFQQLNSALRAASKILSADGSHIFRRTPPAS